MEVGRVPPFLPSPQKRNIEYRKNMSAIALLLKCGPEMFKQLLQSWQWPSSGTSIPLAEESMWLREASTCRLITRPYFTLSTRDSGIPCTNGPKHISGACMGRFSSHWILTTHIPVDSQLTLRCRTSGQRRTESGTTRPLQGGPTTSVCT